MDPRKPLLLWDHAEEYPWHSRSRDTHLVLIRQHKGWHFPTDQDTQALKTWLHTQGGPRGPDRGAPPSGTAPGHHAGCGEGSKSIADRRGWGGRAQGNDPRRHLFARQRSDLSSNLQLLSGYTQEQSLAVYVGLADKLLPLP
jgi:hypothetical protein